MTKEKIRDVATLKEHQSALALLLEEFDRVCRTLGIPYILFAGTMLGAVRHKGFIPWDDDLDIIMFREDYERFLEQAPEVLDNNRFFLQKEFSEHWPMFFSKLRLNNTTCLEKFHPKDKKIHSGVYIDIFPCDNAFKSSLGKRIQFFASKVVIAKSLYKRGYETKSSAKKLFMKICRVLPLKPFLAVAKGGRKNSTHVHSFLAAAKSYSKNVFPREYISNRINLDFENKKYPVSAEYDNLLRILYGDYMTLPPPEMQDTKRHVVLVDLSRSYEHYQSLHDNMEFDVLTVSIR
ncbi:MAG: LicD family protein [Clostridia bacterium]|nr:LicD family protein [Clostridia bacterium]MBR6647399.1 LicD family protein [Clostridia bacterium]